MKTVKIFKLGQLLKQFQCKQIDASLNSIIFHAVPTNNGTVQTTVSHYGHVRWEVNYLNNTMNIEIVGEPEISMFVSW